MNPSSPATTLPAARGVWGRIRDFAGLAGDATYLWPRWLVLRGVGVIFILIFSGILHEGGALFGPRGVAPLATFFEQLWKVFPNPVAAFFNAPTLFLFGTHPAFVATLEWCGLLAAIALTLNLWPRLALFGCWLMLLSFVAAWRVFSGTQLDQFMLETALLCIPFAPAGFRPGLGAASPPRPIALFMVRWLLFRVMFESGVIKILVGDPHWRDFSAMDVLYQTSPFPTILGYLDHQLPHGYHVIEALLTYAAEIAAPLAAMFCGRRGRWFAFWTWTIFQAGIQFTNNFGWLNTGSIALGLLLLDDQMLAAALRRIRLSKLAGRLSATAVRLPPPPLSPWRLNTLRTALWFHFALSLYFLGALGGLAVSDAPLVISWPYKVFNQFRSANVYTLYAGLLPYRYEVEFEGSNDGGETWRVYEFRYQPQALDRICPFIAPWYPRFEATLQVESTRETPSQLFAAVAMRLIQQSPDVLARFKRDPFPDHRPTMIRMQGYRFTFTSLATLRKTGRYWDKKPEGEHLPMMYENDDGAIVAAASPLDELRVMADEGGAHAQWRLGLAYVYGQLGAEKNVAEGAKLLRSAAEHDVGEAQEALGSLYVFGEGVQKNPAEAVPWFRRAAGKNLPGAQFFLGLCYSEGIGVPRNPREAFAWYERAAKQGHELAQANLGVMYAKGEAVPKDEVEALAWLTLAANSHRADIVANRDRLAERLGAEGVRLAEKRADELAKP